MRRKRKLSGLKKGNTGDNIAHLLLNVLISTWLRSGGVSSSPNPCDSAAQLRHKLQSTYQIRIVAKQNPFAMTRTTPSYSRTTPVEATTPLPNRLLRLLSEARWLGFAVISVYLTLIFFTFSVRDPGWSHATSVNRASNWGGLIGAWLADLFLYIFVYA